MGGKKGKVMTSLTELRKGSPSQDQQPEQQAAPEKEKEVEKKVVEADNPYEKRFKDTQKSYFNSLNALKETLDKGKESGAFDDDYINEVMGKAKSNDISLHESPFTEVVKKFDSESAIVGGAMGLTDEEVQEYTSNFASYVRMQPELEQEVLNVPPTQMTKFILEKGKEFKEIEPLIKQHGNVAKALKSLSSQSTDVEKLKEEIRQQLIAEMSVGQKKVDLSNVGVSKATAPSLAKLSLSELRKTR